MEELQIAGKILNGIRKEAEKIKRLVKFMDVCGTHEDTVNRGGIRSLLPKNVEIVAGPGCPVCITPVEDIVRMMEIARKKRMIITTFGDMYRIPTHKESFADFKAHGYDVRVVYSIYDAYKLALETDKLVVHFSPGFETTTAPTAGILKNVWENNMENFKIYSAHRLTPPAVEFLIKEGTAFDGLITPGHVSAIIGVRGWEYITRKYRVPQVVSGFEPLDVLLSVYMLLMMINEERVDIENEYTRVVKYQGNEEAQKCIEDFFEIRDAKWRALGIIPQSGLYLKKKYEDMEITTCINVEVPDLPDLEKGCRCGEVLRGLILPEQCPLFRRVCTPRSPVGPCMVSYEGTCNIFYKYSSLWGE